MIEAPSILQSALDLAATGIPVFPCTLSGTDKKPVCAGGFKAATVDAGRVRSLFAHSAASLIGMPTGEHSGIVVIDIDPRHDGDKWFEENCSRLPSTRTHKTLQGGLHLLFKDGKLGIRNSAGKDKDGRRSGIARGVDVRGNGGYIIWWPAYGCQIVDNREIADLPEWLIAECRKQPEVATTTNSNISAPRHSITDASAYGRAALESAADEIRNSHDGSKHDTINRVGYSIGGLVTAGEILEGDAFNALSDALEQIRPACRDFRAAQKTLLRAFQEGKGRPRDVPERIVVVDEIHPAAPMLAKLAAQAAKDQRTRQGAIPEGVFSIDGLLKEIYDNCLATAYRKQPFFALAAAISAVAVAAGRRYCTTTGLRSNIYIICVANSGAGKDHPIAYIRGALCAAGLMDSHLGGEELASGGGITSALAEHPVKLFLLDEMGMMLQAITGKKAAPYKAEIMALFMKLFSRANSTFLGKEYTNKKECKRIDIQQPHVGILGATTPTTLWESLEGGALKDGSIARFMIFATDQNSVKRNKNLVTGDIPATISAGLRAISEGATNHDYGGIVAGVMLAATSLIPFKVPYTPNAYAAMEAYADRQETWQTKLANTDNVARVGEGEVVARIVEHAAKLAMISAISRNPAAPLIEVRDVTWATLLTNHCARTLLDQASRYVSDNEYEKKLGKAYDLIARFGPITERDMLRRGFKLQDRERAEILNTLTNGGMIEATKSTPGPLGGRMTIRYSIPSTQEAQTEHEL